MSSDTFGDTTTSDVTTSTSHWWKNLTGEAKTAAEQKFYDLGMPADTLIIMTTLILALVAVPLNLGVISFYKKDLKSMVPFIYTTLGLSDLCTGICSALHALVFLVIVCVKGADSISLYWVSVLAYFTTIISFRLSAFISLIFSAIRTINITNPFRIVSRDAVFKSVFAYTGVWTVVFMVEFGLMIEKGNTSSTHFLETVFYSSANFNYIIDKISGRTGLTSQHCIVGMVMTVLPTFIPAVLALIGSAIQLVYLNTPTDVTLNTNARRDKKNISITIVIITVAFFFCACFMVVQPVLFCVPGSKIPRGNFLYVVSYVCGYIPMFLNAALNPLILTLRGRKLNSYVRNKLGIRSRAVNDKGEESRISRNKHNVITNRIISGTISSQVSVN